MTELDKYVMHESVNLQDPHSVPIKSRRDLIIYDQNNGRYGCATKDTGEFIYIDTRLAGLFSDTTIGKAELKGDAEDATSVSTINWLKGQITSLSKKVKALEDGNKD
jgi:hypothetical protein